MNRTLLFILLIFCASSYGQTAFLKGNIIDDNGQPLGFATAALLKPADSTLAYFGITNTSGSFDIRKINPGKYLLQVAYLGYQTTFRPLEIPFSDNNIGSIVMKPKAMNLTAAEISADHIPILIKKDTVEYNAAAYKTKPDAVAEDLIRKLPGVQVDRSGNIKAMGENVKNVLVDGKEFFSSDPKVATKNLPADAINKVQVYNKKSDESELTGIEDASRNKTMNLMLKDDKKDAWFGDVMAGGGTEDHYQTSGKIYRFNETHQFAALGMLNNVNKFGFSFQDYLDFSGGLGGSSCGGGSAKISITSDNSLPIDFGQQVTGLVTSGAGGLNFSYEPIKNNRFYISYLGNGSNNKMTQSTNTRYYGANPFTLNEDATELTTSRSHMLNFGLKRKADSIQNVIVSGRAGITNGNSNADSYAESSHGADLVNTLKRITSDNSDKFVTATDVSYLRKGNGALKLLRFSGHGDFSHSLNENDWKNITRYISLPAPAIQNMFLNRSNNTHNYSAGISGMIKVGKGLFLDPSVDLISQLEYTSRSQGYQANDQLNIDSLSPDFNKILYVARPGFSLRKNTTKTKTMAGINFEIATLSTMLNTNSETNHTYTKLLPFFTWEYEYQTGKRIDFNYITSVNSPEASQLLPVVNNMNPLALQYGNRNLKPEYRHDAGLNWLMFDQFSQTSVFANLNATYTVDKINFSTTVNDSLAQTTRLINVKNDYLASARFDFGTPLRFIRMNLHLAVNESFNRGLNFINGVENINTNFTHNFRLSFNNMHKEKWDFETGAELSVTDARYSIQKIMNTSYMNYTGFVEINYTPTDTWHFRASCDYTSYQAKGFNGAINIPLVNAEVNFNFLKNKRAMLTLEVSDILDKNTGIERISNLNYLREVRKNIIGRYALLSLKYRINKFSGKSGLEIKMKRR